MALTTGDLQHLKGVHPDLLLVVEATAIFCPKPFKVIDGLRTVEEQQANVASGASLTMDSRHLYEFAVDILPIMENGQATASDWSYFHALAPHIKGAAQLCGIPIEWGGDWKEFPDGAHWQLPKAQPDPVAQESQG